MSTATVSAAQRFTPRRPCPICGGHDRLPRGDGRRCYGYLSEDGSYARCTRREFAGGLEIEPESGAYVHRLDGPCRCGLTHGTLVPDPATIVRNGHSRRIVATHDYRDELGALLFQTVRYEPKDFQQRQPDGRGGWTWNLREVRLVPYRLPELLRADSSAIVLIVEGEKDADRLATLGFVATTNPMGAGKWRPEYSEFLRGRPVCIIPDHDVPGEKHATQVAQSLAGVAAEVRILRLPALPPKGDLSDWLDAGGTAERLTALLESAPAWQPPSERPTDQRQASGPRLVVRSLTDIKSQAVDWFWHRWLPRGKFTLVGGHAGDGKSTLLTALAAIGSRAGDLPDGTRPLRRMRTLFLLGEDAASDTLRPRLELHDADMESIFVIETVLDERGNDRFFNVTKHLDLLEAAIIEHDIDWVVIDPLTTIMPGTDRNAEGDTRDALTPLLKLAERRNVTITGVAHVGKPSGTTRRAMQRILGATAFHALARIVWMIAPGDDSQMVLGVVKSNLAMKPSSLAWTREEDGPVQWHGIATHDVEDLLNGTVTTSPRADAEGFLRELLGGGSRASEEVEQAAKADGIAWRTVRRAADVLGVVKWKSSGRDGRWFWKLPDGAPRYAKTDDDQTRGKLSTFPGVDNLQTGNLATPRESEVDKLDTLHNVKLSTDVQSGQVLTTSRNFANGGDDGENTIMEGGQLGHMDILTSGQVTNGQVVHTVGCGQVRMSPFDADVERVAAALREFSLADLEDFRTEVAAAPADDPFVAVDLAALALVDRLRPPTGGAS